MALKSHIWVWPEPQTAIAAHLGTAAVLHQEWWHLARLGMAWHGMGRLARCGMIHVPCHGLSGHGVVCHSLARFGTWLGVTQHILAQLGTAAWHGLAKPGRAKHNSAALAWFGKGQVSKAQNSSVQPGRAWHSLIPPDTAQHGSAKPRTLGPACLAQLIMAGHNLAQPDTAWHGSAWHGMASTASQSPEQPFATWHGLAPAGIAWHGSTQTNTARHRLV